MKINLIKVLILLTSSTFILSCNNDDDSTSSEKSKKVIKRIKSTGFYINTNGETIEEIVDGKFTYDQDNKKLIQVNYADDVTANYTYDSNENLTSIKYSREGFPNYISEITLFYNNQKLSHTLTFSGNNEFIERHEYIYNTQGKFIKENICNSKEKCSGEKNVVYNLKDNNISSIINSSFGAPIKYLYEFDNKINPYRDSQEVIKILHNQMYKSYNENNVVKETQYWNLSDSYPNLIITYKTTYDKDNFPLITLGTDQKGNNYSKIEYEYY